MEGKGRRVRKTTFNRVHTTSVWFRISGIQGSACHTTHASILHIHPPFTQDEFPSHLVVRFVEQHVVRVHVPPERPVVQGGEEREHGHSRHRLTAVAPDLEPLLVPEDGRRMKA